MVARCGIKGGGNEPGRRNQVGFLSLAEREDGLSYSGGSRDTKEGNFYLPFGYRDEMNRRWM